MLNTQRTCGTSSNGQGDNLQAPAFKMRIRVYQNPKPLRTL